MSDKAEPLYAVFECTGTVGLCTEARDAGFGAWIPLLCVKRINKHVDPVTKVPTVKTSVHTLPAVPGYVFVLFSEWQRFLKWATPKHRVKLHTQTAGDPQAKKDVYQQHRVPARMKLSELQAIDEACKAEWHRSNTAATVGDEEVFEVGDWVTLDAHPLLGENLDLPVCVAKCRPTGFIRVFIPRFNKHVEVQRGFLHRKPPKT